MRRVENITAVVLLIILATTLAFVAYRYYRSREKEDLGLLIAAVILGPFWFLIMLMRLGIIELSTLALGIFYGIFITVNGLILSIVHIRYSGERKKL